MEGTVEKIGANEEITALSKHVEQYLDVLMFFTQDNTTDEVYYFIIFIMNVNVIIFNNYFFL